ncbi:MAG: hypothetical protein PVI57_01635 [Gemmatimonadota bacterium]|jgi:hypothetical protein
MELQFLIPIFGILLVMIPVAGVTFALTLRFAVRPFVQTLASALRESGAMGADRTQIVALARAVESLEAEVERLREAQAFDRELLSPPGKSATRESASAPGGHPG